MSQDCISLSPEEFEDYLIEHIDKVTSDGLDGCEQSVTLTITYDKNNDKIVVSSVKSEDSYDE